MRMSGCVAIILALTLLVTGTYAQNQRDIAVRRDKQEVLDDTSWIYDDLDAGLEQAAKTKRPLMVVFR